MNQAAALEEFQTHFAVRPEWVGRAPGRVNLLGEHVDYNGGLALPCAIDRFALVVARPRSDDRARVLAADLDEECTFSLRDPSAATSLDGRPLPNWARYPAGVAWALGEGGIELTGIDALLTSDVPVGAGLASSAAVEVAFAQVWLALSDAEPSALEVAQICRRAENEYVGVRSGLMDQWTSICGQEGRALLMDFASLELEPHPVPADVSIVIAHSGVGRTLDQSLYNERVDACQRALRALQSDLPHLDHLGQLDPEGYESHRHLLTDDVTDKVAHVVYEVTRVRRAARALQEGDSARFGALMLEGHASLRDLYAVSGPELDLLVELASGHPGCYGARLTGAGFGGCTVNWVDRASAPGFAKALAEGYQARSGRQAEVWICLPAEGAQAVRLDGG